MQLNLKNHRAIIFEKNPFDVSKTSIIDILNTLYECRPSFGFPKASLYLQKYHIYITNTLH